LLSLLDRDEAGKGGSLAEAATSGKRIPRSMSSSREARTEIFRSRPEIRINRMKTMYKHYDHFTTLKIMVA
jgi:hypothetical protein